MGSGAAKGGRDVELPAWSKGRYGSAIGRAVHGVLQVVDLSSHHDLEDAVADQCVREDDGSLVVGDYKPDDAPDAALPSRTEYYAPQVDAYRTIVKTATHEPTAA